MNILAPLLLVLSIAMACFTDPQGLGIWVSREQVVSVQHNSGDCAKGSKSKIVTGSGSLCVQETPQQILKTLGDLK